MINQPWMTYKIPGINSRSKVHMYPTCKIWGNFRSDLVTLVFVEKDKDEGHDDDDCEKNENVEKWLPHFRASIVRVFGKRSVQAVHKQKHNITSGQLTQESVEFHLQVLSSLGVEGDGFDDDNDEEHAKWDGHEELYNTLGSVHQHFLLVFVVRIVTRSACRLTLTTRLRARIVLTLYICSPLLQKILG